MKSCQRKLHGRTVLKPGYRYAKGGKCVRLKGRASSAQALFRKATKRCKRFPHAKGSKTWFKDCMKAKLASAAGCSSTKGAGRKACLRSQGLGSYLSGIY